MEKALFNGVAPGLALDGRHFFYENPLASRGGHHRQEWYSCACCPPNLARLYASLGNYFYSQDEAGLWVHLYAAGECRVEPALKRGDCKWVGHPWNRRVA
jgi:DUF1680 family protein